METDWLYKILILAGLLILSAFFSGSEVAFFSLKQKKIEPALAGSKLILRYVTHLIATPRRLLVTILVGNTTANVAASIISVSIALEFAEKNMLSVNLAITIQILLVTIIILLFGELLPKVIATKYPVFVCRITAIPLYLISTILHPVAEAITELIRITTSKIKLDKAKTAIREHELTDLAELGHERGTIEEEEQEIIASYVEIKSVNVSEVMTPRVDMVAIPHDCSYQELVETITETGHSRLPMYKDNLDIIKGIIYAKDLLPHLAKKSFDNEVSLEKLAREAIFVPEKKKINEMLQDFQEKKMHIAIVVDEYGGTAGLITLEDIIEEVVGEIWDEHDQKEDSIKIISPDSFIVLGKVSIVELNETLDMEVVPESENYDTIAGLVNDKAGNIPKEGYSFIINDFRFTVKEILKKRIKTVQIDKLSNMQTK